MSSITLTISLIKEKYARGKKCIREDVFDSLNAIGVSVPDAKKAILYLRKNQTKRPEWRDLFPEVDWNKYRTNTFSGLLLVDISNRRFALTSGSGRFLLDPFAIEEGFGFKTVINSADPETIRKIEKKTINQNPMNSIAQLTRTSGLQDFKIDYYTDIISKIRAKTSIQELGNLVDGRDSLQISMERDIDYLSTVLTSCLESYNSKRYLKLFPNIDNISAVSDKEINSALDEMLVEKLNRGDFDNTWAAMPEIIHDSNFDVFQFSKREGALRYHDVELEVCLKKYEKRKQAFSKRNLETDQIFIRTFDGYVYPKWSVWKCIYSEIKKDDHLYVLVEGKWFRISQRYIERLEDVIGNIPTADHDLPVWKQQDREPVYLASVGGEFIVYDRVNVHVPGYSAIEFCDLYLPDDTFVHVKRYGDSQVLSYLFEQGRTSAKLFLEDRRYRAKAIEDVFGSNAPFTSEDTPDPRNYKIDFLIGSKYAEEQKLPLFARVVLVSVFNELTNYGFQVRFGFIKIEPL